MTMDEPVNRQQQRFDRIMGTLTGLPGVRMTRPSTVLSAVPIINEVTTAVVQTYRSEDDGFLIFLQIVDANGHDRIVIPDRVAQAIYRQRAALVDRSTAESRKRATAKRDRARARAEKADRSRRWRETHPDGMPTAKKKAAPPKGGG